MVLRYMQSSAGDGPNCGRTSDAFLSFPYEIKGQNERPDRELGVDEV